MKLTARKSVTGFLLVLPMMLGFLALYAVPFAMVVANSATQGIASNLRWVGLENIRRLLHNGLFRLAFANTAKFLLVGIPLLLVVAYSIALVVKKYAFQFRAIRSVLLMPYIMPLVGAVVLVDAVFSPAGGLAELAQALGASGGGLVPLRFGILGGGAAVFVEKHGLRRDSAAVRSCHH